MDAQELRNLQEAYLEVVSNDLNEMSYKKLPVGKMMRKVQDRTEREADTRAEREREESTYYYAPDSKERQAHKKAERDKEKNNKMIRVADTHSKKEAKAKSKLKNEEADLYDVILSHLLDEGYAETQEQAEVIMVNMSEDWRESIVEARVDVDLSGQQKKEIRNIRKFGTNSSYSKSKATKERHKLHRKNRGVSKTKGDKSGEKDASVLAQSAMVHRLH